MDAFLLENTGLTLAQTNKVDLDAFDYLPDYDAYYLTKGDTNYRSVTFTSGEREGSYIRLYWKDYLLRRRNQRVRHSAGPGGWAVLVRVPPAGGQRHSLRLCLPGGGTVDDDPPGWPDAPMNRRRWRLTRHSDDCAERGGGFID